jgi:hypothetical protein
VSARWTYSRIIRRIRHIVAADELRSARDAPRRDDDEAASPLMRILEPIMIAAGAIAILVLILWAVL